MSKELFIFALLCAGLRAADVPACSSAIEAARAAADRAHSASLWNRAGVVCAQANNMRSAEAAFRNALAAKPDFAEGSINLAQAYALDDRHNAASGVLQAAIEKVSADSAWLLRLRISLARELSAAKRYKEAEDVARAAIKDHPDSVEAHVESGAALTGQELFQAAADEYDAALKIDRTRSDLLLSLSNALVAAHQSVQAISKLDAYLKQWPRDAQAHYLLGRSLSEQGRGNARHELELAAAADPKLYEAHYFLAIQLAKERAFERALKELEIARALRPEAKEALYALAKIYRQKGDVGLAQKQYDEIRALETRETASEQANMELNLGTASLAAGDAQTAALHYQRAAQFDRANPKIPYSLSLAWKALKDEKKQQAALEEAVRLDAQMAAAWNELGLLAMGRGDRTQAEERWQRALRSDPEHVEAANNLAVLYTAEGEFERATELLERAIEDRPAYAEAVLNLGLVKAARGEWEQAAQLVKRALQISPRNKTAQVALGMIEREMKSSDQRRPIFETVAATDRASAPTRYLLESR